jgi:uroporphyrinogen-III decarboxylase
MARGLDADERREHELSHPAAQEGLSFILRDFPLGMNLMSLYGNPRNYMGVENFSIALYDDFDLVLEMLDWQAHMAYTIARKVIDSGILLDFAWIWEDMCFNKGPLVSPAFVKDFLAPRYRKVIDLLRENGTHTVMVDCDGNIDLLLPIWIECGINATYPLECASGMDARHVRKKYGNSIILVGNVDKRALAQGRREIDNEVEKVREMIHGGGYFVGPDHHVPPDVSWGNISYFISEIEKIGR